MCLSVQRFYSEGCFRISRLPAFVTLCGENVEACIFITSSLLTVAFKTVVGKQQTESSVNGLSWH